MKAERKDVKRWGGDAEKDSGGHTEEVRRRPPQRRRGS